MYTSKIHQLDIITSLIFKCSVFLKLAFGTGNNDSNACLKWTKILGEFKKLPNLVLFEYENNKLKYSHIDVSNSQINKSKLHQS